MTSSKLDAFAEQARTFCRWATGEDGSNMSVASALRRVSSLYIAALELPPPFTKDLSSDLSEAEPPSGSLEHVSARASKLPLQAYWEVFDPLVNPAEEPVVGDLVDDIGDIYRDVARGLTLFDSGKRPEALWEWGFNFRIHWGEHATGALRALHAYLVQEEPDGLSQDA